MNVCNIIIKNTINTIYVTYYTFTFNKMQEGITEALRK